MAVIDVAGFVADVKSQAIDHGFHVHDERHFVETYSLRQLWEVDLHPEEACAGPIDLHLSLDVDPRAMLAGREDAQLIVVGLRTESHLEALVSGSTTEWLLHHPPAPLVVAINTNPVRSVLICVDGSAHALAALNAFANLPLSAEASAVTVLAVDDGRANANDAIEDAAAQLAPNDIEAQRVVVPGSPTQAILDYVVAHNPDMVVLGTRGLTGLKRLRLGSTAAAVVRSAKTTRRQP